MPSNRAAGTICTPPTEMSRSLSLGCTGLTPATKACAITTERASRRDRSQRTRRIASPIAASWLQAPSCHGSRKRSGSR